MLIVIPTYRRLSCLRWVLQSATRCDLTNIEEDVRVVVVNNYPPYLGEVRKTVCETSLKPPLGMKFCVLARERTLEPVDNWYSAIEEHAREGECVLLHGDDDLLLPNSIKERRAMMIAANADMGLSKPVSRIYFSADGDRALFVSWEQLNGPSLGWLDWGERHLKSHESSFISNHTYRYTPCFRDGLSLAREACATQEWVDSRNRNLMLPYYLPFAIKQAGGRVTALDSICVVRGADLSEITNYPYGVANWNTCFVNLLAFCLFRSGYFSSAGIDNAAVLTHFEDSIRRMLPTLLLDRRLKWPVVAETLRRAGLSCWDLLRVRALAGYKALLLSKLGLTGWRIARKFRQCSQPAEAVINAVWSRRGATSNSCS